MYPSARGSPPPELTRTRAGKNESLDDDEGAKVANPESKRAAFEISCRGGSCSAAESVPFARDQSCSFGVSRGVEDVGQGSLLRSYRGPRANYV
jgi:hypothetical protein